MASEDVWVSEFLNDPSHTIGTNIDRSEPGWSALANGQFPSEDALPLRLYINVKHADRTSMPPLFDGEGGVKLSSDLAAVFAKFNLGSCRLMPAQLFHPDKTTLMQENLFVFTQWDEIEMFSADHSRVRKPSVPRSAKGAAPPPYWRFPFDLSNEDIAVFPRNRNGLDLWIDRKLFGAMFFSDRLTKALVDAGYKTLFKFRKCKIVRLH